jgi:ribonuclease PH
LADCRIRDAAARNPDTHLTRAGAAGWSHSGDSTPDRTQCPRDDFKFGEFTVKLDCDVLVADGGTRTAAITGASVAIVDAFDWMVATGKLAHTPVKRRVAAVSVGVIDGEPRLDLDYEEDVRAEVDMNVVMSSEGKFVEVQGTGEHGTFDRAQLDQLLELAISGIRTLDAAQIKALSE